MPGSVIYVAVHPEHNSIRYWAYNAADAERLEKETGLKATRFVAAPAAAGRRFGGEIAGSDGAYAFVDTMVKHADIKEPFPAWHGWALREAFAAGWTAVRAKPYCYEDCTAYTAGIEKELQEARDALEAARNGLQWYRDTYPESGSGADDEMMAQIDAVLTAKEAPAASLHPKTADLVRRFTAALAEKLAAAEKKYGYSDGWASPDWMDECRQKLGEHIAKGDPRDVAAYCAFLWHHGESTAPQESRE